MTIAVIKLLGTSAEKDIYKVLSSIPHAHPFVASNREKTTAIADADGIVIPGGYYRRDPVDPVCEQLSSEILTIIAEVVSEGKPVLGVGHGFQTLIDLGILPGRLLINEPDRFVCKWVYLRVCNSPSIFTEGLEGAVIRIPVAHLYGRYDISEDELTELDKNKQVKLQYCDQDGSRTMEANPDGSTGNVAGISNAAGNVLGMMPYPERASRQLLSSTDGRAILRNFVAATKAT